MNYDLIAIEDLQIQNMVKNRNLAKSIFDGGWGYFAQRLSAKTAEINQEVVRVPPLTHPKHALDVEWFLRVWI